MYELLVQCYRSGQMSERQWQDHLNDQEFKQWFNFNYPSEGRR